MKKSFEININNFMHSFWIEALDGRKIEAKI